MDKEPRKASDVLLDLESSLNVLLNIVRAQDLNIKVLSNKLNNIIEILEKQASSPSKITVEAVNLKSNFSNTPFQQTITQDPERQIPISAEANLPMEIAPKGFRRTSRPETFSGDDAYLNRDKPAEIASKLPTQASKPPPGRTADPVAQQPIPTPQAFNQINANNPVPKQNVSQNTIPVMQRIVDKNGKSVFLADIEITDLSTMQSIFKTRTNGTGKWMAPLSIGDYKVTLHKMKDSKTKEKFEVIQNVHIDGSTSPLELQMMIIK